MRFAQITRYPLTFADETVYVSTAKELVTVLEVVGDSYDRVVLEQLRPSLAHILSDPNDLALLITSLTPENQLYLLDTLGCIPSMSSRLTTTGRY